MQNIISPPYIELLLFFIHGLCINSAILWINYLILILFDKKLFANIANSFFEYKAAQNFLC